jgi:hypothetical protein
MAVLVWAGGCALPQVVPEALNTEFRPTGTMQMYNRTASFDAVRVRSPKANMSKRTDGSWGGTIEGFAVDVSVTDTMVRGVNLLLTREESTLNHIVITGQFQGRIYRFELDENLALIRTNRTSLTFKTRGPVENGIAYGPLKNLVLQGDAAAESPPWPQFAFALMAMFD